MVATVMRRFERRMAKSTRKTQNQAVDLDLEDGTETVTEATTPKKKRGRPRKNQADASETGSNAEDGGETATAKPSTTAEGEPKDVTPSPSSVKSKGDAPDLTDPEEKGGAKETKSTAKDASEAVATEEKPKPKPRKKATQQKSAGRPQFWHILRNR